MTLSRWDQDKIVIDTGGGGWQNEDMNKPSGSRVLIIFSVLLLLLGVLTIVGINMNFFSGQEIRAKAAVVGGVKLSGTVESVNLSEGKMVINNVQFTAGTTTNLGTWTIIAPREVNLGEFSPGMKVYIGADPKTFVINDPQRTLTAVDIKK